MDLYKMRIAFASRSGEFCFALVSDEFNCTLIRHRNGVIKCSKLKWNHETLGEWFHCHEKFSNFFFFTGTNLNNCKRTSLRESF